MQIRIGAQIGGVGDKYFTPLHSGLNKSFRKHIKDGYFKTINELYMAFRVSGHITDFKSEGPERMRYMRKQGYISIDLVFPESSWCRVHPQNVHDLIISGVEECLSLMIDRADKEKELLDRARLEKDIKTAIDDCRHFEDMDYGDLPDTYKDLKPDPKFE